jgi:hypothetical protein
VNEGSCGDGRHRLGLRDAGGIQDWGDSIVVTFARFNQKEALSDRPVEEGHFIRLGGLTVVSSDKFHYSRFHEKWMIERDELGNHVIKNSIGPLKGREGVVSIVLPLNAYPTRISTDPQNAVAFANNRLCVTWPYFDDVISVEVHVGVDSARFENMF